MTLDDLLAGIAAHPHEGERWLILADWLEDQSDPRAELARLRYQYHYEPDHPDFETRRQRLCALATEGVAPLVPSFTNSLGMTFVLIPPGKFWMGSRPGEGGRDDESWHRVRLSTPYYLGLYPVTVGDYRRFLEASGYRPAPSVNDAGSWHQPGFSITDQHPVVWVDWHDAAALTTWLTQHERGTGVTYTLPTEAQWEFACRAATPTPYFWGHDVNQLGDYAWFDRNADKQTHPVPSKLPNPWGLWQMAGNVWEWCYDWYGRYPSGTVTDPTGAAAGTYRVLRGGAWLNAPSFFRSAYRVRNAPSFRSSSYGLRLAALRLREDRP